VHTALERGLLERLGPLGGKLRAGRSRNDQVATDLRLYLRDHARALVARAVVAGDALIGRPSAPSTSPAPGMTHLQHAQPVLFAHQLLAHAHALLRDVDRLRDWDRRPRSARYGSGALAGSSLPLDPTPSPPSSASTAPRTTRSTPSATATSPPSSASPRR
jgi:argininosuccinate lyase